MARPKVGREYQHLEDLAYIEGSVGALTAVEFLRNLSTDATSLSLKWDGGVVIYWGRDDDGDFVLTTKNGWNRCKANTAEQLKSFILSTGKNEEWRETFAQDMCNVFSVLQRSTPQSVRGYYKGDILWHPGKPLTIENNRIVFTPNQVTYYIDEQCNLGNRAKQSAIGIAVHAAYPAFGCDCAELTGSLVELETSEVLLFGQTRITDQVTVDHTQLNRIQDEIVKNAPKVDAALIPTAGLADIKNIIYSYVNHSVKNDCLHMIEHNFESWLTQSTVSNSKKNKLISVHNEQEGLKIVFSWVKDLASVKDNVIELLDQCHQQKYDVVHFSNDNEGYVCNKSKIKLVPRLRWKPR